MLQQEFAVKIKTKIAKSGSISYFKRNYSLYLLLLPAIIYYIIFCYLPMIGVTVAFKDYNIFRGIFKSEWAGLKYFREMLNLPEFYETVRNTLTLNLLSIAFGFPAPIILALMLNELRSKPFQRICQSLLYLPHFMSWIILAGIITNILSPQYGLVNHILRQMGIQPIFFMADTNWWVVIYIFSGIWQSAGWGTIIYIAALTAIDPSLYEAATVDGAGKWKQLTKITIPCLMPTVVIMLILRMGTIVSIGFEQPMALYNPVVSKVAQVISTYIYYAGVEGGKYSLTTAIGLLQSVINLIMVLATNKIAKLLGEEGLY